MIPCSIWNLILMREFKDITNGLRGILFWKKMIFNK